MSEARCAIVLAAGQGTRMKSSMVKVLHPVAGRPMVRRVVDAARGAGCDPVIVVIGRQGEQVRRSLADLPGVRFAVQSEQRGTGDAVRCAAPALDRFEGTALLLPGDVPLIRAATLDELAAQRERDGALTTVLSMELDEPKWYGRVLRGTAASVSAIVEARDCDPDQLAVREVNSGLYAADLTFLFGADGAGGALATLRPDNDQGELYLTDIVAVAAGRDGASARLHGDPSEVLGVNDRVELARVEDLLYARTASAWMADGVTIHAPDSVRVDPEVELAADVVLEPRVQLQGETRIATGAVIETAAMLRDTVVGEGARIGVGSVLRSADVSEDAQVRPYTLMVGINEKRPDQTTEADRVVVGADARIGPFSHLRMRSRLAAGVHLGNFVETKNTDMDDGAKANHLAYLGDGHVGARSNVGAGVIFCNYDGLDKHRTDIGEDAFVGSDSQLVAPVRVGDRAYVGSGTTVTREVPDGALVVTRAKEKMLKGFGDRKHERIQAARATRSAAGEQGGK
jgi:bifunctional UDP-N-acetylglucosamine pyrophosphorylase / glucosamine-1-phosphate N-acetyltransferase